MSASPNRAFRWLTIPLIIAALLIVGWAVKGSRLLSPTPEVEGQAQELETNEAFDEVEVNHLEPPAASTMTVASAEEPPLFQGFCPHDVAPFERPTLEAVVNARLDELAELARRVLNGRQGSAPLRRGLSLLYTGVPSEAETNGSVALLEGAPDRVSDNFDLASVAAMVVSVRALREGRLDEAARWAGIAARDAASDPAPFVLEAIISRRLGNEVATRAALRRAFELAPRTPGIALAVGRSFSRTAEIGLSLRGLDNYLTAFPRDAVVSGLAARMEIRLELVADFRRQQSGGVTTLWSPEVSDDLGEQAHEAVLDALDTAAALLGTPRRRELTLFIYSARADLLAATCVQSWARAAFDGALHLDGEGLRRQGIMERHILHESAHAQLAEAAPNAPVWLHEGLAQYIARQRSEQHEESYRFMIENQTWVPFTSLGGSFQVITDGGDARLAYHQSLAMVEILIDVHGEAVLHSAVAYLQRGGNPLELFDHLAGSRPMTGQDLLAFLRDRD